MRKSILFAILILGITTAKAQMGGVMEYKPATPITTNEETSSKTLFNSATAMDAYYIDTYTKKAVKIKIKIVESKYGTFIVGCKKLADVAWADLSSEPIKVSKILPSTPMAEYFEYKAFIARLQQSVYF